MAGTVFRRMAVLALCAGFLGVRAWAGEGAARDKPPAGPQPAMSPKVAVPTEKEAVAGLSPNLAPIQKRAGQRIRRETLLARRILLAFLAERRSLPDDATVDAEVARVRLLPLEQVFGCCADGTFDDHLAQRYMTPDDFRETVRTELGLRRLAEKQWDARILASPETRRRHLADADPLYQNHFRRVWIMLFLPARPAAHPAPEARQRAEAAAKRMVSGEAWEAVAKASDNHRGGLPPDGDLGCVPQWRPLVADTRNLWATLGADRVSPPQAIPGGGWALVKWVEPAEEELLAILREEETAACVRE